MGGRGGGYGWQNFDPFLRGVASKVLVTGGAGYFGHRLGRALAGAGYSVILLDIVKPRWDTPQGVVFHQGDVRDFDSLIEVCQAVDCIFHAASYGMSGPEQLKKEQIESINVGGTSNVIKACLQRGVSRLVYTSTVNVAFAGQPIEEGDEDSVPYVPLDMHIDHYSRTKAIAEAMVLESNGHPLKGKPTVYMVLCVGDMDIQSSEYGRCGSPKRLFSFSFGNQEARINWVHVDNLVMAHILAADGLTPSKGYVASGQAYFINDGEAVNLFEWFTPLVSSDWPVILPLSSVYRSLTVMVLSIPQVRNIAVTHTFRIEKARRELGFNPRKYKLADSVDQYLQAGPVRANQQLGSSYSWLLILLLSLAALLIYCWECC
uniref:Short chain dehydrogenase/reductase family 42E, member 2 n=1 Tax=Paramormyrops kingsleyae TaxID=1676925 RepID=A0A3B3T110_9TELE